MESAFGIDHGDVSKALFSRGPSKRQQRLQAQQANKARRKAKLQRIGQMPGKALNTRVSVADVGRGAGKGAQALGAGVGKKPGLTGAVLIGGGGYAAYRGMQRDELPKRRKPEGM